MSSPGGSEGSGRSCTHEQSAAWAASELAAASGARLRVRPTRVDLHFSTSRWDQFIYQLMVMRYTIGLGDELAPLRYRLLPTAQFINIEYYEERQRQKLPVDGMVRGHRGYLIARPPNPNPDPAS